MTFGRLSIRAQFQTLPEARRETDSVSNQTYLRNVKRYREKGENEVNMPHKIVLNIFNVPHSCFFLWDGLTFRRYIIGAR